MANDSIRKSIREYDNAVSNVKLDQSESGTRRAYEQSELDAAVQAACADLMAPSPCGQTFDGTPHPKWAWRETHISGSRDSAIHQSYCLVCASEQKLRDHRDALAKSYVRVLTELTTLRDRVKELEAQLGIPKSL